MQTQGAEPAPAIMEPVVGGEEACLAATETADPTATPPETAAQRSTDSSSAPSTITAAAEGVESPVADGLDAEAANEDLLEKFSQLSVDELAEKLAVGRLLLQDILASLARPGRDPREDLSPPVFRREILKLEDLKPGMELSGTVLNVVDFGAFVDIGLSDSGLIHVSRLADRFVSDPHEVVSVGDVVNVWVVEVDEKRRRVSLTAIQPGTERARPRKEERRPRGDSQSAPPRRKPRRERSGEKFGKSAAKSRRPAGGWQGKRKAKPAAPITDAMAEGREPMRTFSDLQQFFQRRKGKPDEPKSSGPPPSESSD